jgi:uncharacterized protein YbbC (DUF1343 family)
MTGSVKSGLDVATTTKKEVFKGKRIATIVNHTAVTKDLVSFYDIAKASKDYTLAYLYSPPHGVRGDAQDSEEEYHIDKKTGVPVYPSYSLRLQDNIKTMREHKINAIVVDLQQAGARYYGHKFVMCFAMDAAAKAGIELIVLDRPNPIAPLPTEGEVLDLKFRSGIGWFEIPNVHGMTHGELATMYNEEYNIKCNLTVVKMEGWKHHMWYEDTGLFWPVISPNLPTVDSVVTYAGTCLFEGCNISEGRGTTRPFEIFGAPWLDAKTLAEELNSRGLPGIKFGEAYFIPTPNPLKHFSKFAGEKCQGVRLYVTDRKMYQPVRAAVHLLDAIMRADPEKFKWREKSKDAEHYPMDILAGSDDLRTKLEAGIPADDIVGAWKTKLAKFKEKRKEYLLYK